MPLEQGQGATRAGEEEGPIYPGEEEGSYIPPGMPPRVHSRPPGMPPWVHIAVYRPHYWVMLH